MESPVRPAPEALESLAKGLSGVPETGDFHRGFPYPAGNFREHNSPRSRLRNGTPPPSWNVSLSQHSRAALATVLECPRLARIGQLGFSVSGAPQPLLTPRRCGSVGPRNWAAEPDRVVAFVSCGRPGCHPRVVRTGFATVLVRLWLYRCDIGAGGVERWPRPRWRSDWSRWRSTVTG